MKFATRLKQARERRGLNQTELGKMLGVSAQAVQQWEASETRPRHARIDEIAKALQIRPQWLLFEQGEMIESGPDEMTVHDTQLVEANEPLAYDEVEIPYFREVEMAAGDGRTQVVENHGLTKKFQLATLAEAGVEPHNAGCATLVGDSMYPAIRDGSLIGIDKGCKALIDGDIYALDHGGTFRVKYLYKLPPNRMRVVSENSVEFPEEVYMIGDPDAPQIIGRVFYWESIARRR